MAELRDFLQQNLSGMKTERSSFDPHWRDISDFVMPRTSRFFASDRNRGNLRNMKINDSTATMALRTLQAGLISGVTNPARPWIQMRTTDPDLNKWRGTRIYLDIVRDAMSEIFLKSNLYTTLPNSYSNLGGYGTDCFDLEEDEVSVVRCYSWPIGSYYLAADHRLSVDTAYREFQMTCVQMVRKFGLDNVSDGCRDCYQRGNYTAWFTVYHAVEQNPDFIPGGMDPRNMQYRSIYWERGSIPEKYLRQSGYHTKPFIASRWQLTGEDIYGSSPGMDALGDVMALQLEQRRKVSVIDKHVNPPTQAPVSLERKGVSNVPGGVTYVDAMQNGQPITPTYQTQLSGMQYLLQDIGETQGRINTAFYRDLFLMLANSAQDSKRTAYEVARLEEEKLLALGPVYMRLNDELLDPLTTRTMQIMVDRSRPYWEGKLNGSPIIPPPPPELAGADIQFEYISTMSQAMKSVGVNAIERTMTFAGNLAQAFPDILDNISGDRAVRTYADINGTPADMMVDEKQVEQVRAQRAKQAQMQQSMAMAQQGADAANKLANAPLSDNNALSQLLGRMQQQQQQQQQPQGGQ